MVKQVEDHNRRLAEEVTKQVGQLERALQNRTPEEVIIRYLPSRVRPVRVASGIID